VGTSSAHETPTTGNWSDAKKSLNEFAATGSAVSQASALAHAVQALHQVPGGTGGGGGGAGGGGGGGPRSVIPSRGRSALSGGLGFLADATRANVREALQRFGIRDIEGRDGAEVINALSAAIVGGQVELDEQLAVNALRDTLLDALGYEVNDFDASLREYMASVGLEGFVLRFLTKYVTERIWMFLGTGARERIETETEMQALFDGFAMLIDARVTNAVRDATTTVPFHAVDWFGAQGVQMIDAICDELVSMLREAA